MSTTIRDLDLETLVLKPGVHSPDGEFCVMEAVSYIAGEPWSDSPECASPVISALLRNWNDSLDDDDRQMLKPLIPKLVNSKGSREVESQRVWLALDWLIRVQTPAWLRLATLNEVADELEKLPPVVSAKAAQAALPTLNRAQERSAAAGDAAWDAARDAAWDAARAAAWDAARAAAGDAARAAAGAAAWAAGDAVRAAAWATGGAWDAAGDAAWATGGAWDAAGDAAWATGGAWDAAGAAVRAVAWATGAVWDVARAAAWDAAWAAWDAARAAAGDAAWAAGDAARAAAWAAAWAAGDAAWATGAAGAAVRPTVETLQRSALELVDRMLAV